MKKFITLLLLCVNIGMFAQHSETIAKSVPLNKNQNLITFNLPIVKSMKMEQDTSKVIDFGIPPSESIATPTYQAAAPPSTWLNMVQCIIASENISCEDLGCTQLDTVMAGTWVVRFEIGQRRGGWSYWVQGTAEPLLNYHNGVVRFGNTTVQIWQQILSPRRLSVGDELIFAIK